MKRRRVRLRRLVPLALLLIPPLFWATILAIAPTGWARTLIVKQLNEETRRPVQLGGVRIGVLGGIYLLDLKIGAEPSGSNPWLKADWARIDISVLQLLAGQLEPSTIEVNGLDLRLLRRADGSLELADLLAPAPRSKSTDPTAHQAPSPLEIKLGNGKIAIIDEASHTQLNLEKLQGHAVWQGRQLTIQDLHGQLNGGTVELALSLDRTASDPAFEGRFRIQGADLDQGAQSLTYLVPFLAGTTDDAALFGRLDANFYLKGQGATRDKLRRTLDGQGTLHVDSIALQRSKFFVELAELVNLPDNAVQVGTVTSDFVIQDGRVGTENLTLQVARLPIILKGWTDFDGRVDYRIRSDSLTGKLPEQARDLLADLSLDSETLAALRVHGTLQSLQVSLAPGSLASQANPSDRGSDRAKLRDLGRRLRERVLR